MLKPSAPPPLPCQQPTTRVADVAGGLPPSFELAAPARPGPPASSSFAPDSATDDKAAGACVRPASLGTRYPADLEALVDECLNAEPSRRPTAAQAHRRLCAMLDSLN